MENKLKGQCEGFFVFLYTTAPVGFLQKVNCNSEFSWKNYIQWLEH